ncbi:hypothetical protein NQ315_005005 [Exocentrus adspersus]|uniref:Ig-like domain-containing protein n=1 Tax=Exocentrus adspersus TaxID=1586481 RepID=A0AAV8VR15_9CUCU|nr:hypothetical protein NQ315_005005 [Exocentrus adspersus]
MVEYRFCQISNAGSTLSPRYLGTEPSAGKKERDTPTQGELFLAPHSRARLISDCLGETVEPAINKNFFMDHNGICSSRSLKGMRLNVPRAVRAGHSVTLSCEYDLEDAPLYSVKWYRDNDEFYRYVPKEAPPTRVFSLPGLHVDKLVEI